LKDLNFFFDPNQKKEGNPVGRILIVLIVLSLLMVGGLYILMDRLNSQVRQSIAIVESQMAAPELLEAQKELNQVKGKLTLLQKYEQGLTYAEEAITRQDRIRKAYLDQIAAALPVEVMLETFQLSGDTLTLEVLSTDDTASAELIHNLKQTGLFSTVELSSTTREETDTETTPETKTEPAPVTSRLSIRATMMEVMPE